MAAKIRILASSNKAMQRIGYLKLLAWLATRSETSNLAALSARLFEMLSKRVPMSPPFPAELQAYAKHRLADPVYQELREAILGNVRPVSVELQDLYLSDPELPSNTGKLHKEGARGFAYLGTAIDFVKPGTWSAMTRSVLLLQLTTLEERQAFESLSSSCNPMLISREQGAAVLFSLLENDAEAVLPMFQQIMLAGEPSFGERTASDYLADVLKRSVTAAHKRVLSIEDRERLAQLDKTAKNLEKWKGKPFSALSVREEHVRVRLEPYCDMGLLRKPEPHRFAYEVTPSLAKLVSSACEGAIDSFLCERFFATLAGIHEIEAPKADCARARAALGQAGLELKSPLGYAPIRDCALLAGIRLLFQENLLLEVSSSHQFLREWQREMPDVVRFTVDRMGEPINVKFTLPKDKGDGNNPA